MSIFAYGSNELGMENFKFSKEYEIRASVKMLYPYFATPSGLSEWFAEEVEAKDANIFRFHWDNEDHIGRIVSHRLGKAIKFEFDAPIDSPLEEPTYLEFKLDFNEMTNTSFVKVTDYSEETDEQELHKLWDGLIAMLKEIVGG